jgi:hypothetical protein
VYVLKIDRQQSRGRPSRPIKLPCTLPTQSVMANAMIQSFILFGLLWPGANHPPGTPSPAPGRRSLYRWLPAPRVPVTLGWFHPGRMAAAAVPVTQLSFSRLFFNQVVTGITGSRYLDSGWPTPARRPVCFWAAGIGGRTALFDFRLDTIGKSSLGRVRAIL